MPTQTQLTRCLFYAVFTDSVWSAHWSRTMHVPEDVIDRVWSCSAVKNLRSGDTTSFWVLRLQNGCWHRLSARMLSPPQCELVSFLNRPWGLKYAISFGKMNRTAMSPCWLYTESTITYSGESSARRMNQVQINSGGRNCITHICFDRWRLIFLSCADRKRCLSTAKS